MKSAGSVDHYIETQEPWARAKLEVLRSIALASGLTETLKWGGPVYVHKGNVLGMAAFKNWVALWFYNGVFLADEHRVLVSAGDGTKALRQWRFAPQDAVHEDRVRQYILEAIANDEKGLKLKIAKSAINIEVPTELAQALSASPSHHSIFQAKTLAQQREYAQYVAEAKLVETRIRRVQKVLDLLVAQAGLNDKYKR